MRRDSNNIMIIQIPEHFSKSKNILKLPTLSFMYYFSRAITPKVHVQINRHMLIHVFNGSKIIYNNDTTYTLSSNQSAFISKGQYFMSEILSVQESCFDGVMVFFDDAFLLSMFSKYPHLNQDNNSRSSQHHSLCIVADSKALHETMLSTKSYLERKSDESLLVQLKFEEVFLQLLQSNTSDEILTYFQALYSKSVFKFKDLFENNTFENVEDMIAQSKLSSAQFRKLFYQLYETTPKEWLLKKSLAKAKKLLEDKTLNVTEVCYACGFNSISWFIKSFKKEFGLTPKKYQQNC
jgi:AraC-like DNA-binding protein